MRKQYTAQFKAQVVQEILKEEKTLNQLATEHGIHPNQLKRWKATILEGLAQSVQQGLTKPSRRRLNMSAQSPSCTPRSGG